MRRARPYSPQLNRSHPLADRIGFFAVPGIGSQMDLVNGTMGAMIAGSLNAPTPVGEGYQSTSNSEHGYYWPWPTAMDPDGDGDIQEFTLAVFAVWVSWSSFGKIVCFPYRQNTTWTDPFVALSLQAAGDTSANARIDSATTSGTAATSSTVSSYMVADVPTAYVVTRSGTTMQFWRDGRLFATPTFGSHSIRFGALAGVRPNLYLCQRNHQVAPLSEGCRGTVLAAGLWPRALSADEVRLWSADPFGLARPPRRLVRFAGGLGGSPPPSPASPWLYYQRMRAC